jgi:hypothetical protein
LPKISLKDFFKIPSTNSCLERRNYFLGLDRLFSPSVKKIRWLCKHLNKNRQFQQCYWFWLRSSLCFVLLVWFDWFGLAIVSHAAMSLMTGKIGEDHSYPGVSPLGDGPYHHHKFYQWVIFFLTLQVTRPSIFSHLP